MYNPFSKGRWYRFVIESNGTNPTLKESDLAGAEIVEDSEYYLVLPLRFKILSVVPNINSNPTENPSISRIYSQVIMPTGNQGYFIPAPFSFSSMELYIFAVKG